MAPRDPYLSIAHATEFVDYLPGYDETRALDFLLELTDQGPMLLKDLARQYPIAVNDAHLEAGSSFVTARMPLSALNELVERGAIREFELSEPLRHQRTSRKFELRDETTSTTPVLQIERRSSETTLVAIIDDACPFAHQEFRRADGPGTRVVALWDMDPVGELRLKKPPHPPAGFFRGVEVPGWQMDDWMKRATSQPGGVLDEDACYETAGSSPLAFPLTHGSHLLGRLAGRNYSRTGNTPDAAAKADIAFVQLPRQEAESPGGGSIHFCIVNALRYLRQLAAENGYKRCVVACGWGSILGPHDGSSLFERALENFLSEDPAVVSFDIVFPAGNGHEEKTHVLLSPAPRKDARAGWVLPPGNEVASFAELWIDELLGAPVEISLKIEGDPPLLLPDDENPVRVKPWLTAVHRGNRVTLRAAPTSVSDASMPEAQAGPVTIVARSAQPADIHGYVCWGGSNLATTLVSKQSEWQAFAGEDNARVTGSGSLLGDGCGHPLERIHVVGGYVGGQDPRQFVRARYSAAGPTRGMRLGPDFLALTDDDFGRKGILGPGTRTGTEVRVWGTSVAVPQAARALVNTASGRPALLVQAPVKAQETGRGFLPP